MDLVTDALANGRWIKCLTCVDDFTKECLTITAAFGISGVQVTRILDSIALFRGYPATIKTEQGPEFTCRALDLVVRNMLVIALYLKLFMLTLSILSASCWCRALIFDS